MYYSRLLRSEIENSIDKNPVTAILGARQVGKTTFSKDILNNRENSLYVDLEKPSDRAMLEDPEQFFKFNNNKTICLDEIQLRPNLFAPLRSIIDDEEFNIKVLITGSSSPELLKQSAESLAGRIAYFELTPFLFQEIEAKFQMEEYWLKGGFPLSLLNNEHDSTEWRLNFIRTFLERDLRAFGYNLPSETLRRLWRMLAHVNGQTINYSQLANSLGVSDTTVRKYIDVLAKTFMIRILEPSHVNLKKRLIRSPKLYIRDTGILHALLGVETFNEMLSHPVYGSSWELLCIENILSKYHKWNATYYRTSHGNEIDLVLSKANKKIAVEFKTSSAPKVSRGFWEALDDIDADHTYIIAPVKTAYPFKNNVWVYPLHEFLDLEI